MPSFQTDIRPLFREYDRENMDYSFDLWEYDDVKDNADDILDRLEEGDMPCDAPWPEERIALFRQWMEEGMEP
ncbi:MAG TPA: hypothetical protein VFA92_10030 [Candidatus Binatia bacterium]|jgi:hypothetical protein|nr:hypothetical protein [Candidatus Dormibacteraeota bacterium]MBO0760577.1 hypothetical protein [Candidatus Dormibacteraeota bacterium]HYZ01822.1 hypothetical protein [Candidatus Binatia bacterium]